MLYAPLTKYDPTQNADNPSEKIILNLLKHFLKTCEIISFPYKTV